MSAMIMMSECDADGDDCQLSHPLEDQLRGWQGGWAKGTCENGSQ